MEEPRMAERQEIDLVILDIIMPGLGGGETAAECALCRGYSRAPARAGAGKD